MTTELTERRARLTSGDLSYAWPGSASDFWRLLNKSLPTEPGIVRAACLVFLIAYIGITVVRVSQQGWELLWCRVLVLLYAGIGSVVAPRLSWQGLRRYTLFVPVVLGLTTSYIEAARGFHAEDLTLAAVATFAGLPFVLTARDLLLTDALLLVGNVVVLAVNPSPTTSLSVIWTALLGAVGTGTAVGALVIGYRAQVYESLSWWQESLERERIIREFVERTAAALTGEGLVERLSAGFQATIPGGHCLILMQQPGHDSPHVLANAQSKASPDGPTETASVAPIVRAISHKLATHRGPLTHEQLGADELSALAQMARLPFTPGGAAIVEVQGFMPGMVVLLTPAASAITSERLGMWRALANQSGIAMANAHAWEELRLREADARRLAEERGHLAEMRTRFISTTSHEFRTPLAAILTATEALDRYGERMTSAERCERLRKIRNQVLGMSELLADLLILGRAEAGQLLFTPERVDLAEVCEETLAQIRAATNATHRLAVSIAEPHQKFTGDPKLLRQILGNLLTNAVKYSPEGGRVELKVERRDGSLELRVSDEGIGIPPEEQPHLFEAFRRGNNVGRIPGSGLGLTITQKAVEIHGGSIGVESTPGAGTTFIVSLPDPERSE